jgi:lysozyme
MALKILKEDVEKFLDGCKQLVTVNLNPNQIIALVSFTYNNGLKALESSTLLKRLNAGEDPNKVVDEEFPKWRCITLPSGEKEISKGIVERRNKEIAKFKEPFNIMETKEFNL